MRTRAARLAGMKRTSFAALALVVALAAIPGSARSQQPATTPSPTYRVELLVFRPLTALGGPENWAARSSERSIDTAPARSSDTTQVGRFSRSLGYSELQLRQVASRLQSSGDYEVLAHAGWMQTASDWGTRAGFSIGRAGIRVPGLTGTVFLERGQFLHLGMSLNYEMPVPPDGIGAGPGTVFNLDQSRRIKFYERNYYDHPAFGVIALVTPAQGARPAGR
jgi:hypothetical protein